MKTKTKQKILKVVAICILFLGNSQLMAQMNDLPTQTVCVGDIEPYTLVDPVSGPPTANYSYQWSSTGGVFIGGITVGDNIDIDWNTVGVYTVTVVATDIATGCEDSPIDVVVTVEDLANPPVAINPAPICLGDPNPQMTAATGGGTGNGVFNWYADAGLTTLLQPNSATYTDPTSYPIAVTYDYWVTEESANACEGSAIMVTVSVTPLPSAPSLIGQPYEACFGLPNPLFTATGSGGSNFNWYDAGGGLLVLNNLTYTSIEVNPGTYSYFVEEVVGSCVSLQTTFTFIIHAPPAAPSINPSLITICEGETPVDFVATTGGAAGMFTWYDVDPVANPLAVAVGTGTPFSLTTPTSPTTPGVYNYWLTETNPLTGCVTTTTTATFTINELPLAPIAPNPAAICFGDANPQLAASTDPLGNGNGVFNWYADATLTTLLSPNSATYTDPTPYPAPGVGLVQTYDYWVAEVSVDGCEGSATMVTVTVIALPVIPQLAINPVEICFGDANPAISPIGATLVWYDVDPVANPLAVNVGTGASFTPPASAAGNATTVTTYPYWVVDQPGTCTSLPLQVDLQINPLPTPGPIFHN